MPLSKEFQKMVDEIKAKRKKRYKARINKLGEEGYHSVIKRECKSKAYRDVNSSTTYGIKTKSIKRKATPEEGGKKNKDMLSRKNGLRLGRA